MTKPFLVHDKIIVSVEGKWYEFPTWEKANEFYNKMKEEISC
jgi:hypothetical protein